MPVHRDLANAIRVLSMDAVQKANSGHPGMPMGMADSAVVLWNEFLQHNPENPTWPNRDRFIVSNGHGCMLLYALLHLTGYALTIDDIKQFRQWHSKTPGHPEWSETPGVETTTGPLGQGLANAVGMALAETHLAAEFNRPELPLIDHFTYAVVGDGCLMEGISHEVCSLAGTLKLGKLIVLYDDNQISIDGEVEGWFTDDTAQRFESYHWHVIPKVDGHDPEQVRKAIQAAQANTQQPSIICLKTTIGYGAPALAGSAETHGAPLGDAEIKATRQNLNWSHEPFVIPEEIYQAFDARPAGKAREAKWQTLWTRYQQQFPDEAAELERRWQRQLPTDWAEKSSAFLQETYAKKETIATRKASQNCLNFFAPLLPELIGGSADLTGSNLTNWRGMEVLSATTPEGRYIHYGVREFGMSAMMNGMALYGALIPFGGTFLTFSDYARNAIRLAALMKQKVIFVYTHDSLGLGEDGPTHQPIEHLPSLRLMPGLEVWRPADTVETVVAWQQALEHAGPSCLLFTRQAVPYIERMPDQLSTIARGAYVLKDCQGLPDIIMMATGSEVSLIVAAANQLSQTGVAVRVVAMPCIERFLAQDSDYREAVLPEAVRARLAVEAAASATWYQFVGSYGKVIGCDRFGASAPAAILFKEYGFTVEHVLTEAKALLVDERQRTQVTLH